MQTNHRRFLMKFARRRFSGWLVCGIALLSCAAGALLSARWFSLKAVRADGNRVFELMVYHVVPGKESALESIFRDVSKLQVKHDMNVIGYWVPNEDRTWQDTFIYLVAFPSRDEANKNWHALHADPEFPQYRDQAAPFIEKTNDAYRVDEVYMRPTDYSAMK